MRKNERKFRQQKTADFGMKTADRFLKISTTDKVSFYNNNSPAFQI